MSRIGNKPVVVPAEVKVAVEGNLVKVEGPKGKLQYEVPSIMTVSYEENTISILRPDDSREAKAFHGLSRSLVNNMVVGVSVGFKKDLEIRGVGYRGKVEGNKLELSVGFSHPCKLVVPEGITVTMPDQTKISVEGADKQAVGQVAAVIRGFKKPEPYKGKGIRYVGEFVAQKEGKKVGK
ncbi:MAG: 50S ribosomal protein L6 [Lentisphaeria bacterium]